MDEAEVVRKQVATLNKLPGVYCLRTHGGTFQQKGTPDIMGCAHGFFFSIESKLTKKDKASPAQLYNLKQFRRAKGKTFVSRDPKVEEVVAWIRSLPRSSGQSGSTQE